VNAATTLEDGQVSVDAALDAYSRVVVDVARRLAPTVASLRVSVVGRGGRHPVGPAPAWWSPLTGSC
jgi:hypothetical protein